MDAGLPSSRDEMGEGGDDFDSAERGRCADLLCIGGGRWGSKTEVVMAETEAPQ